MPIFNQPQDITPPIELPIEEDINKVVKLKTGKRSRINTTNRSSNDGAERVNTFQSPEYIAKKRTNEPLMRFMAGLAINLAIKARDPARQNEAVRRAEHGRLQEIWGKYTRKALRLKTY
ncbi:MAG TPA: hypothetical protein PKD20_00390 [Candidatus Saccharibacteria bacterium]|nr:hypothetical protein [Candidatus Saccharibacteria bacterium]